MGAQQSYPGLTQDVIEDYASLTYLTKDVYNCMKQLTVSLPTGCFCYVAEQLCKSFLMKKFYSIDPEKLQNDPQYRFYKTEVINKFPVLKNNPFQDRIFHVFSSKNDDCFSFEDILDLCSVMSSECPIEVKSAWAFRIFDLDDDNEITAKDICQIVDRLTCSNKDSSHYIDEESKMKICDVILKEINLDYSGGIGCNEFKLVITRIPEFSSTFYFRL